MLHKKILLTAICGIFFMMPFTKTIAQQRNSAKENLFIELPESVTLTPNATTLRTSETSTATTVTRSPNRSFDGTNNNLGSSRRAWGSANIPFVREIPAVYGPNNSLNGANRPSARKVSNLVVAEPVTIFNARNVSTVNYFWGQFLDHDITLTPTGSESAPIPLPSDEELFTEPISFTRSAAHPGTGSSVREQTNLNTAWIDASVIYGSDAQRARWLRTFRGGKLKISAGNLMPFNTLTGEKDSPLDPNAPGMANDGNKTIKTFVAGDVRASEHAVLSSFHTLFVREHNRICDILIARGQRDDEKNYQYARKIVGGLIQNVTYNEFLPSLGVFLRPYSGYRDNIRPDLTNIFATAGYRLGHSMVADEVLLIDNNCHAMEPEALDLVELFWNPELFITYKPETFLKGIAAHTQYETNIKVNDVLRNFLFGDPASPVRFGVDLGALNIQRGRDHGLPDYNTVRRFYTGTSAASFRDIHPNDTLANNLKSLYGSVNNVDLWTGILAEDLIPGRSIGRLAHEIQRVQFEKLRDGDFYYFENDPFLATEDRNSIRNSRLSDIIKRNTTITNLQSNVFFVRACPGISPTPASVAVAKVAPATDVLESKVDQTVFPNPSTGLVNVAIDNSGQSGVIQIFSGLDGALVRTIVTGAADKNVEINISDLPKGIYTVNINNGKEIKSVKVLKQ